MRLFQELDRYHPVLIALTQYIRSLIRFSLRSSSPDDWLTGEQY